MLQFLADLYEAFLEFLIDLWVGFWSAVLEAFIAIAVWAIGLFTSALDLIPVDTLEPIAEHLQVADKVLYVANVYVPLAEIGALIGLYFTFVVVVWTIRHAVKAVPFIG